MSNYYVRYMVKSECGAVNEADTSSGLIDLTVKKRK